MLVLHDAAVLGARLQVVVTERDDGDVHPGRVDPGVLGRRQRRIAGANWAMADQVHGRAVWQVDDHGPSEASVPPHPPADVVCSSTVPVAMWSADCVTAVLATRRRRIVGVHAGWRGLAAGVIDVAVSAARGGGDLEDDVVAVVAGPSIGPCCYEFGPDDLRSVAAGVGAPVDRLEARTAGGATALDVRAALQVALERHGLRIDVGVDDCTACSDRWWSHRAGLDSERQALVGWWG